MSDKTSPAAWALAAAEEIDHQFFIGDGWDRQEAAKIIERHAEGRWIPVTPETLPPHNYHVIIIEVEYGKQYVLTGFYDHARWYSDRHVSGIPKVTHWQPLPDAPEEGR